MTSAAWGLGVAVFLATVVEMVEALTIVVAMGVTRGWRSAFAGTAAAVLALVVITAASGYALTAWLPRTALQLAIGLLLLIFGMQWLRKAVLRASGRKGLHDEAAEFREQAAAARLAASDVRGGLDWFGFTVSFKGVLLEGIEVVFIVITFGLNAGDMPVAIVAAALGVAVVVAAGSLVRGPMTRVPENTLKFCVALLLVSFGTFWSIEGLGVLNNGQASLHWPGGDLALLVLLGAWALVSRLLVRALRRPRTSLHPAGLR